MPSKKILILSVVVSLLAHALLIWATGLLDRRLIRPDQETIMTVNLRNVETPPPQPTKREVNPPESTPPQQEEVAEAEAPEEETVSLDSEDEKFAPYLKKIKQKIEHIWSYPPEAFAKKNEGVSTVAFSVDNQGRLVKSAIVESSGSEALDQGTIKVIRAAAPYAPFPPEITFSRLNIQATFKYRFLH